MINLPKITLVASVSLALWPAGALAQGRPPSLNADWNLEVLTAYPDEAQLGSGIAAWLATHSVQELNPAQTAIALDALSYGGTSADSMSVRWTGGLTPPSAGTYTFSRGGVPNLTQDWVRVWINGKLVLDTSSEDSAPVAVQMDGSSVSIRVDYSRTMTGDSPAAAWPIPCARLLWSRNSGDPTPVAVEAITPNDGAGDGLSATYFSDAAFQTVHATRVDRSIDLIWDDEKPGVAGNSHTELRAQLASRMTNAAYIQDLYEDLGPWDASTLLTQATKVMSGADREQVALLLLANPGDFATMNGYALTELMWQLQPVSTDLVYELLVTWAQLQPRYATKPGEIPGWHRESYLQQNWNRLAHLGRALAGRYRNADYHAVTIMSPQNLSRLFEQDGFTRPDGSASIHIIPAACYACKETQRHHVHEIIAIIDQHLAQDDLTGDQRASWHIARALCLENDTSDTPSPGAARRDLELAFAAAETDDTRFWAFSEQAVRLISAGDREGLDLLVAALGDQLNVPNMGLLIERWSSLADEYNNLYQRERAQNVVARQQELVDSLQSRLDRSIEQNDSAGQARYERLLSQAHDQLADMEAEFSSEWDAE